MVGILEECFWNSSAFAGGILYLLRVCCECIFADIALRLLGILALLSGILHLLRVFGIAVLEFGRISKSLKDVFVCMY